MRFLHLSDLHLGKRVCEFSMLDDQRYILEQILSLLDKTPVDGVLLAGDLYDKPVPPAEAVRLLDWFLTQLAARSVHVCMISGNHDSPERLQFGSDLLQKNQIHIAGTFSGKMETVSLSDAYGTLTISMLPYVKLAQLSVQFPEQSFATLDDGIRAVLEQTPPDPNHRNLLLYHGFVLHNGAAPEESDSETQLGGLQLVSDTLFDAYDYVALGHIHKPQWVQHDRIRYSGSLMKYSFSECLQQKSVTLLNWKEKDNCTITIIPLHPKRDMRILHGALESLLKYATPSEDFIRAELTDLELIPNAIEKLRVVYPNTLELSYIERERLRQPAAATEAVHVEEQSLLDLVTEFYENVYHYPLREHPEELALMTELVEEEQESE